MILGLDISTTVTAFSVLTKTGELVFNGTIVLNTSKTRKKIKYYKYTTLLDKVIAVKKMLLLIKENYTITDVCIEAPLKKSKITSNNTILVLTKFNGILEYICHDLYNVVPVLSNVKKVRSYFKIPVIKKVKNAALLNKIEVLNFLLNYYPNFQINYSKNNKIKTETLDRSDSLLMAYYYYIEYVINNNK